MRRTSDVGWNDGSGWESTNVGKSQEKFRGKKTGVRAKATQRGDRSTRRTTHPWVKTNKFAQEPTRSKILGMAIFGGDFRNRSRTKQK